MSWSLVGSCRAASCWAASDGGEDDLDGEIGGKCRAEDLILTVVSRTDVVGGGRGVYDEIAGNTLSLTR